MGAERIKVLWLIKGLGLGGAEALLVAHASVADLERFDYHCAVVRDDKARVTRYELRLPLAAVGLEPGDEFGFNVVLVDDDGDGQPYWLRLAPGLPGSGNTSTYPKFVPDE